MWKKAPREPVPTPRDSDWTRFFFWMILSSWTSTSFLDSNRFRSVVIRPSEYIENADVWRILGINGLIIAQEKWEFFGEVSVLWRSATFTVEWRCKHVLGHQFFIEEDVAYNVFSLCVYDLVRLGIIIFYSTFQLLQDV